MQTAKQRAPRNLVVDLDSNVLAAFDGHRALAQPSQACTARTRASPPQWEQQRGDTDGHRVKEIELDVTTWVYRAMARTRSSSRRWARSSSACASALVLFVFVCTDALWVILCALLRLCRRTYR